MGNSYLYSLLHCLFFVSISVEEHEIPSDMKSVAAAKREELIECVANVDNILGEMFLTDQTPSSEDIMVSLYYVLVVLMQ